MGPPVVRAAIGVAVLLLASGCTTPEALPAPTFIAVDGVGHTYAGGFNFFVGGGVAAFDCNQDRMPDLFLAGGEGPSTLLVNRSEPGEIDFEEAVGTEPMNGVTGAYPIDLDSDGLLDLAVLRFGENVLLQGLGDCRFERANERWGFDGGAEWTTAFSARWTEDGFPDLALGNYLVVVEDEDRRSDWTCEENALLSGAVDGFGPATALRPSHCTLSLLFTDWDGSGSADLRVSNDRHYYVDGQEQLWDLGGPTPSEFTADDGWRRLEIWGMGIALSLIHI